MISFRLDNLLTFRSKLTCQQSTPPQRCNIYELFKKCADLSGFRTMLVMARESQLCGILSATYDDVSSYAGLTTYTHC